MNILDLKRKSLGWVARDPGDSTGGDSSPSYGTAAYGNAMAGMSVSQALGFSGGSMANGWSTGGWASKPNEQFTKNEDGTYSLDKTADRIGLSQDDRDTLAAVKVTQGELANLDGQKPSWYNAADPGIRESIVDTFTPDKGTFMDRLGIRPGMSQEQFLGNETGAERADRMAVAGSLLEANIPGMGLAFTLGRIGNDLNNGASMADAFTRIAPGVINSFASPALNKMTGGAYGQYQKVAGWANTLADAGLPTVNPGAAIWSAATGGKMPAGSTINSPTTGEAYQTPGGAVLQTGGWSSGAAPIKEVTPETVAPPVSVTPDTSNVVTNMRGTFDGAAVGAGIRRGAASKYKGY